MPLSSLNAFMEEFFFSEHVVCALSLHHGKREREKQNAGAVGFSFPFFSCYSFICLPFIRAMDVHDVINFHQLRYIVLTFFFFGCNERAMVNIHTGQTIHEFWCSKKATQDLSIIFQILNIYYNYN